MYRIARLAIAPESPAFSHERLDARETEVRFLASNANRLQAT